MFGNSSNTARATLTGFTDPLASDIDWVVGPDKVIAVDPGEHTGVAFFDTYEPEPSHRHSVAWWGRQKARMAERKREKAEEKARDALSIFDWAGAEQEAKEGVRRLMAAGDRVWEDKNEEMRVRLGGITGSQIIAMSTVPEGEPVDMTIFRRTGSFESSAPVSASRSPQRQVAVLETIDVDEVFWDIASMIDAHRNGATALDPARTVEIAESEDPIWEDLTEEKWDPTRERGPREREWAQREHRRNQPVNKSRKERRGKK